MLYFLSINVCRRNKCLGFYAQLFISSRSAIGSLARSLFLLSYTPFSITGVRGAKSGLLKLKRLMFIHGCAPFTAGNMYLFNVKNIESFNVCLMAMSKEFFTSQLNAFCSSPLKSQVFSAELVFPCSFSLSPHAHFKVQTLGFT